MILVLRLAACLVLCAGQATRAAAPVASPWTTAVHRAFLNAAAPNLESGYALAQDPAGFIWLGTQSGLVRWDGYGAREYSADRTRPGSLPDAYVRALFVDRQGTLWIGTNSGGLARLDRDRDSIVRVRDPDGVLGQDVTSLAQRPDGGLWVVSNRGLARLDAATGQLAPERLPPGVDVVRAVLVGADGTTWLGGSGGLWARAPGQAGFTPVPLRKPPRAAAIDVLKLLQDSRGRIWVGTHLHGTFVVDKGARLATPLQGAGDTEQATDTVYALAEAADGEIWIGTYGAGLLRVDPATGASVRERHDPAHQATLLDDDVAALLPDRDGRVWVATAYGLSVYDTRYDGVATLFGGPGRAVRDANVPAILATAAGSIFLATGAQGAQVLTPAGATLRVLAPSQRRPETSLPRSRVIAMADAPHGDVWIGTQAGLYRASGDGRRVQRIALPGRAPTAGVWALLADGPTLWMGGTDGLWELDTSGDAMPVARRHVDRELGQAHVRALALGHDHALWIGTNGRVFRLGLPHGDLRELPADPADPQAFPGGTVSSLLVDARGRLWIASLGQGVQVQVGQAASGFPSFRRIAVQDGLPDDGVDALLADADGDVWASTDDGVARIDPATFAVKSLRAAQGAGVRTFWTGAATRTSDGQLLFGGEGGVLAVDPRRLVRSEPPLAPPVVTAVTAGTAPVAAARLGRGEALLIPAAAPRLQVEFTSLAYGEQDVLRYAYRLQGFDNTWNEAPMRSRMATYTRLPPGRYRLAMRVGRTPGDWSDVRTLDLQVEPRWFERPEVRAAAALLLLGLAWGLHVWRLRRIARRQASLEQQVRLRTLELEQSRAQVQRLSIHNARSLEQERTRVSRELHDEMAQQLAALRMELSVLQHAQGRSPPDQALPVPALVQRVDAIIRSIRELVTQLRPPALDGGLRPAIEWMATRFEQQTGTRCTLELQECAAFADEDAATMAFRVVQESLTNVRRHANATSVRIRLAPGPQGACLEVRDDGAGFDPGGAAPGYGLLGMRERVTALGGRLEIVSSPGQGTTVRVVMA